MSSSPDDILPPRLRVMQLVAGAMIFGVLALVAVALFIVHVQNGGRGRVPPQNQPVVSFVAAALLVMNAPLAFILPGLLTQGALRRIASGSWRGTEGASPEAFATDASKLLTVARRR